MMDAVNDTAVETVCVMSSAQVGKTELLNNVVGFYVAHDASPILVLQPTVEMAEAWSKDRLDPMLRDSPCLQDKVNLKVRNSGNTILHKSFPGGHITMAGANSPASLASRPIRIVLCDEIDRYPASAGDEGDPVTLARKRTNNFWNRKIILTSTPTVKGASRIEREFELSDKRRFYVPCPHCGHKQRLEWKNIVFNPENMDEPVIYACQNGCVIEESHKPKMVSAGEWIAEAPFKGRAGFHINELYSPWRKWREVVADFIEAKDTPETLKAWVNTSLGETWEQKGEEADSENLIDRVEQYDANSLPDDILLITAAVDTQDDRLEARSQGWGEKRERWNIEKKIFWGDPGRQGVWDDLDAWLKRTYKVSGRGLKIACAVIDSGGHKTNAVYDFVKGKQKRRIFAIKGSSEYYAPLASKPRIVGRQRIPLYSLGTDTAKDSILLSSLKVEAGPGCIHFPVDFESEEFDQLAKSEHRIKENVSGKTLLRWRQKRERNEELDLHVYNLCAYAILNPNIDELQRKRKQPKPEEGKEPVIEGEEIINESVIPPTRRKKLRRKKKSWVTDF